MNVANMLTHVSILAKTRLHVLLSKFEFLHMASSAVGAAPISIPTARYWSVIDCSDNYSIQKLVLQYYYCDIE